LSFGGVGSVIRFPPDQGVAEVVDDLRDGSSDIGVDTNQHADMRLEVVKREINQGALAGMGSAITDQAALLVIAALDSYDEAALWRAYRDGYHDGFEAGDKNGRRAEKIRQAQARAARLA
jgi:hypothetical protein